MAHSRACCWQNRNTPGLVPSRCVPMRYRCCWNGPRSTFAGALRKSSRLTFARGRHDAGARVAAVGRGRDERGRLGLGVDRRDDLGGRVLGAAASVPSVTTMSLPLTATLSGAPAAPWLELGGDLVAAVLAPVLGGEHDRGGLRRRGGAGDRLDLEREVAEVALVARDLEGVRAGRGERAVDELRAGARVDRRAAWRRSGP